MAEQTRIYWDSLKTGKRLLPHVYRSGTYLVIRRAAGNALRSQKMPVAALEELIEKLRSGKYCLMMSEGGNSSPVSRVCDPVIAG